MAVHRTVQSLGGDPRLTTSISASSLSAAHTFVRPEHGAALLLAGGAGAPGGGAQQPQLLPAQGPSGPAPWLMDGSLQQQVALPHIEEGRPVSLWWRVVAGVRLRPLDALLTPAHAAPVQLELPASCYVRPPASPPCPPALSCAGEVAAPPEQVHIAPPAPRPPARQHDGRRPEAAALPAAVLDLPASLEYASGCARSHSCVLAAPVRQPFSVRSVARELPSGGVAVQCTLASNMAVPATLSRLALQPQPGFAVSSSLVDALGLLPATLPPFGALAAAFLLAPDAPAAGAEHSLLPPKLQPSALTVDYSVDGRLQCGVAAPALAAVATVMDAAPAAASQLTPTADALSLLAGGGAAEGRGGGGSPTTVADSGGAGAAGVQHCSFRHLLTLEMPAADQDTSGEPPVPAQSRARAAACWCRQGGRRRASVSAN